MGDFNNRLLSKKISYYFHYCFLEIFCVGRGKVVMEADKVVTEGIS